MQIAIELQLTASILFCFSGVSIGHRIDVAGSIPIFSLRKKDRAEEDGYSSAAKLGEADHAEASPLLFSKRALSLALLQRGLAHIAPKAKIIEGEVEMAVDD